MLSKRLSWVVFVNKTSSKISPNQDRRTDNYITSDEKRNKKNHIIKALHLDNHHKEKKYMSTHSNTNASNSGNLGSAFNFDGSDRFKKYTSTYILTN